MQLDESQQAAVDGLLNPENRLVIMTGYPGSGKTTVLKTALGQMRGRIKLCAPTGKAAKRATEVTGREATTIHRLIFARDVEVDGAQIDADIVVVDESSMIDVRLLAALIRKMPERARLVLVGDAMQLPPVGAGQPFHDLLDVVPTFRLTKTHRQAGDSWVIDNARQIISGETPDMENRHDFTFVETQDIVSEIVRMFREDPSITVLSPQNERGAGVYPLNIAIQAAINPPSHFSREAFAGDYLVRAGDRVLQTANDPQRHIVNGDIGTVVEVLGKKDLIVQFDCGQVRCVGEQTNDLKLAYAMTVHKCVAGGTLIETDTGLCTIDAITKQSGMVSTVDGMRPYSAHVTNPSAKLLRLTTKRGYTITVTTDHKLRSWDGSKYVMIRANALNVGSYLRLKIGSEVVIKKEPQLPSREVENSRAKPCRYPEKMTPELALWLGLMVGDGTVYEKGLRLVKRHKDVVEVFAELTGFLFGRTPKVLRSKNANAWCAEINSSAVVRWCQQINGLAPNAKRIPNCILQSSTEIRAAFLRGLFEDGSVCIKAGRVFDHVEWSTVYPDMAVVVQTMLLSLGIVSSREAYGERLNPCYRISIYLDSIGAFRDKIGFVAAYKNEKLDLAPTTPVLKRVMIPISSEALSDCDQATRQNAILRGHISKDKAIRYGVAKDQWCFMHDKIATIEELEGPSFCLTVPSCGSFLQNGFDGSNSQGSEWKHVVLVADVAHGFMLRRQLVYTAVTRTSAKLTIVGSKGAIAKACRSPLETNRRTALKERLSA